MFSESVELYDVLYATFKDYRAEAAALAALVRSRLPGASTLLDVACGTGEHARHLAEEHGFRVDGIDLEPGFVRLAAVKVPGGNFVKADMKEFALEARYDVVACLFSSIGYLTDVASLEGTLRRFRAHTRPGGLVIVEPWFEPEQWQPGRVTHISAARGDTVICRVSRADADAATSIVDFHYLIASPAGIEHRSEVHRLRLFTRAEMLGAFAAAGLEAEHDPQGLTGRGLYIARAPVSGAHA